MNATQTIMDAIRILQDQHCRRCRIGQALINLKPLLDESPPQEDRDAPTPEPAVPAAPIATRTRRAARARKSVRNLAARKPKAPRASATPIIDELDQHLTKVCNVCGKTKPLAEFPRMPECTLGVAGQCKACIAAKARARYEAKKAPAAAPSPAKTGLRKPVTSGNRIADLRGIELPFTCTPCRARFRTQAQLDEHNRVHHSGEMGEDDE
jgi:hypothetical protein